MISKEEEYRQFSRYAKKEPFHDGGYTPGKKRGGKGHSGNHDGEKSGDAGARPEKTASNNRRYATVILIAAVFAAALLIFLFRHQIAQVITGYGSGNGGTGSGAHQTVMGTSGQSANYLTLQTETESETKVHTEAETEPQTELIFEPHAVESTQPSNMIELTGIELNDEELADTSMYRSPVDIEFDMGDEYTQADGIFTFRGNNFRDDPTYGHADIKDNTISQLWSQQTGSTTYQGASWTGSGWTGQPLMRKWTREEKAFMNMEDWAKEDDDLVEVIYATMDGYVYFLDLVTGEQTREPMYIGWTFKGAGALDPRGYPILYLGAGYDSTLGVAHAFIVNLVDCTVMYEFGGVDAFSLRGTVGYFDSSPLVDAETDMLIWPGENGIIYMLHLNSSWDVSTGTLTLAPGNMIKWHYKGIRSGTNHYAKYWLGIEDSFAAYKGYLFATDNGGHLMCLDLNTLQLVWVQDTLDDSNSSPVLSDENGHLYLYTSTSFRLGWRSTTTATVPIWKIDAETGEKIWEKDYECYTMDGVSGGVQSTMALGKNDLEGNLYATVAMTGAPSMGVCVCLDRDTGEVKWEHQAYYAWSSPVCVYNEDGSGRLIYCSCGGYMYMLDPETGEELAVSQLSNGAIEASPAVYGSYAVIGTRACQIWGLRLG